MQERQGGGYEPPIVIEPDGGPIPPYRPVVTDGPDEHPDFPTRKA